MIRSRTFLYRLFATLFFCFSFLLVGTAQLLQQKVVSGSYKNVSVKQVLEDLQSQSGLEFSYSPRKIPEDQLVSFSVNQVSLDEALQHLFRDLPVEFREIDGYIILKKSVQASKNKQEQQTIQVATKPQKTISKTMPEAKPEIYTISGYLKDKMNGESLPGATVFIESSGIGTITNEYGYFSIKLPKGDYVLSSSYVGFSPLVDSVQLYQNQTIDFALEAQLMNLTEVLVNPFQQDLILTQLSAGQVSVNPLQIQKAPALMGETDVIKALEYIPGINFYGEGSGYYNVRGGYFDQNLIVLDEAILFKPTHMLGLFSPIIPDAVKKVDVYKADFPIGHGGRLSNVVDVKTKDGNKEQFSASGNLGLLALRSTVEGPIKKGVGSYFVSYRRSYFDAYLKNSAPNLNELYFADFTGKLNFRLGAKDHLYLTLYNGNDQFRFDKRDEDEGGADYRNFSTTLRWNHLFGDKAFLNTTVATSSYNYNAHASIANEEYWNSKIANGFIKSELTAYHKENLTVKYGLKLSAYEFEPGIYHAESYESIIEGIQSNELILYSGVEQKFTDRLKLNYGLRLVNWSNTGRTWDVEFDNDYIPTTKNYEEDEAYFKHTSLEPRLSLSYKLKEATFLKASYNRNTQYLNLINNSLTPFNYFEVWLPSSHNIAPQKANVFNLGLVSATKDEMFQFQTDLFYKVMYNLVGYKNHAFLLNNPLVEGELRQGNGDSYGLEFNVKKQKGKLTGQMGYTYARSFVWFEELNKGDVYRSNYDRPHTFFINLFWQASKRWHLSSNLIVASGLPITTPTGFYYYQDRQVPQYEKLNNQRLPTYQRFDLAATFRLNKYKRRFNHFLNISVMNALAHQNPIYYYFNKYENDQGELLVPSDELNQQNLTTAGRYVYGFLPSVSYDFKF